jgi:hypothetical protein
MDSIKHPGGVKDWIVDMLCTLYAEQGRVRDGLAYLDALKARRDEEEWEFFVTRLRLMAACDLREEAIEQAWAHPEGDSWYAARSIAELPADAGRIEEAVVVLERHFPASGSVLAGYEDCNRYTSALGAWNAKVATSFRRVEDRNDRSTRARPGVDRLDQAIGGARYSSA